MKAYPPCRKCGKRPDLHALIRGNLACEWDKPKSTWVITKESDFGPAHWLVVADLHRIIHPKRKLPTSLLDKVLALKKEGITTW